MYLQKGMCSLKISNKHLIGFMIQCLITITQNMMPAGYEKH